MEHTLLTARLIRSVLLSEKTKHLEFDVEEVSSFDFFAGQFISVREPRGEQFVTRAYSIASPPRGDNTFDLVLNRVEEGFMSNFLCDRKVGETARFHGPHGLFLLKPDLRGHDLCRHRHRDCTLPQLCAAPLRTGRPRSHATGGNIWLVYGTRYPEDIYYQKSSSSLAAEQPNFHYISTLSRPREIGPATGDTCRSTFANCGPAQGHARLYLRAQRYGVLRAQLCSSRSTAWTRSASSMSATTRA